MSHVVCAIVTDKTDRSSEYHVVLPVIPRKGDYVRLEDSDFLVTKVCILQDNRKHDAEIIAIEEK